MLQELFVQPEENRILLPEEIPAEQRGKREYRILALDPGGTTGWCLLVIDRWSLTKATWKILDNVDFWSAGQLTGSEMHQTYELWRMLVEWRVSALVIEDFILRTLKGGRDLLAPVRVTAGLEHKLWVPEGEIRICPPAIKQQPSLAMSTMTDGRMRECGVYLSGQPHANDGIRHAFTWARRKKALRQNGK